MQKVSKPTKEHKLNTEDAIELDTILADIAELPLEDEADGDDWDRHGWVDEDSVHLTFPEEAGALYGVLGMTIPIATILDLLAKDSSGRDARLFRSIRTDFHPGDDRHEFYTDCLEPYVIHHGGPSISMEERAGIRLSVDANSAQMKTQTDGHDGSVALEELWAPFAEERQNLIEEREGLTERWQKLERDYSVLILEQKEREGAAPEQDDPCRKGLDKEHDLLLAQSKAWMDRYNRLWQKIHQHGGISPYPLVPQDWFWNIAWSPQPAPFPQLYRDQVLSLAN